jgi:hypothetical protein
MHQANERIRQARWSFLTATAKGRAYEENYGGSRRRIGRIDPGEAKISGPFSQTLPLSPRFLDDRSSGMCGKPGQPTGG